MTTLRFNRVGRGTFARWLGIFGLAVVLAIFVSACGGDDDGDTAAEETTTEQTASEDTTAAEANPDVQGKEIGWVDVVATVPLEIRWIKAFEYAADQIGWTVQVQDAAGDPNKALTATRNFVNSGVDGIVTSSIAAEWIRPAKAAAESAGVPLVNLISRASPGVFDADVDEAADAYSAALAEKLKEDYPDGAKVGVLIERVVPLEVERLDALVSNLEGSGIEMVAEKDIPLADQPSAQKATIDMVNANPEINAIVSISGSLPGFILPGLKTLNRDDISLYSWYADSLNAELMQRNPQFAAVVDSDIAKASFVAVDELLNSFTGGEMTEQQYVDVEAIIVTADDVSPSIEANQGPVPYEELIAPFLERWGADYGLGPDAG